MNASQLINQTSGDTEIYTPSNIIEAARRTMGDIDLDPASSARANERVKAGVFYGQPDWEVRGEIKGLPVRFYDGHGGLDYSWTGKVWMNHPFGTPEARCKGDCKKKVCEKRGYHLGRDMKGNADWVGKAALEHATGRVTALCMICFASTSEAWFRPLLQYPQCFLSPRTNYLKPDGTVYEGVTKGSVVTYMGPDLPAFAREFSPLGEIKVTYRPTP